MACYTCSFSNRFHEYAHIIHGHLDFYKTEYGLSFIEENQFLYGDTSSTTISGKKQLDALTSQTLKFNADVLSTKISLLKLKKMQVNLRFIDEDLRPFVENRNDGRNLKDKNITPNL